MNSLLSQVSYPVFLYMTFVFFLIASVFSLLVGVGLAIRSRRALRFFDVMNRWVSLRRAMKPLSVPHQVDPILLKRPFLLGTAIIAGAATAILLLQDADLQPALLLFDGFLSPLEMANVADNLKLFLLFGNAVCLLVGLLILFFPRALSVLESYTDRWYTGRKSTLPLDKMHMEVDNWVLQHPTSVGATLTVLSFTVGMMMLSLLENFSA